jgi:hypothetical protein
MIVAACVAKTPAVGGQQKIARLILISLGHRKYLLTVDVRIFSLQM